MVVVVRLTEEGVSAGVVMCCGVLVVARRLAGWVRLRGGGERLGAARVSITIATIVCMDLRGFALLCITLKVMQSYANACKSYAKRLQKFCKSVDPPIHVVH